MTTTTIIYTCGCQRKIETERPLTKEQWQAEKEQRYGFDLSTRHSAKITDTKKPEFLRSGL